MDIAQPALIANIPGLQTPLIARPGGHTFSHADISGNARVHFGDVFNVSNDRNEPPQEKPFTVPFCRDENFIPRDTVVEDMLKKVDVNRHTRAALYGLGGVGKTQIAIEFAYSYRDAYPNAAVFWLFAGTPERLLESFVRIAADLNLPGHDEKGVDVFALVLRYLEDFRNGRWLLVVDNVDDNIALDATTSGFGHPSISGLPQTRGSMILATTRDRHIAQTLVGRWSIPIAIESMSEDDAALLLEMRLPQASLRTPHQEELLKELEFLPLAISQASSYMLYRHVDTTQYLQLLRRGRQSVLSSNSGDTQYIDVSRDRSQTNAVFSTIQMTIARLAEECALAEALLMILATCNAQFIPQYFIEPLVDADFTMQDIIEFAGILCELSLIRRNATATGFAMYKLVQGATQAWIVRTGQTNIINIAAGMVTNVMLDCADTGDWLRMCQTSNHAHDIVFGFGRCMMDPNGRLKLLALRAQHLMASGRSAESCEVYREARDSLSNLPPDSRKHMADIVFQGLAMALLETDPRDEDALALLRYSIKVDEKLGLPAVYKYLASLDKLTRLIASKSLSENREVEILLLRIQDWCQPTTEEDDYQRGALAGMNVSLSEVYTARYRNWDRWREEVEPDLKGRSAQDWLAHATDTAREACVQLQTLTTLGLDNCAKLTRAALALGQAFREADQLRECGWCVRHALCITRNTPHLAEGDRAMTPALRGINAVQDFFQEPRVTKESFAAEHKDCRIGLHGCRFFDADLD